MYGNGTIDYDGPERLPLGTAATRIKQKRVAKATAEDPIIITSSSDDGAPRIIPAKKKSDAVQRTKAAVKGKRKAIVILDSGDDEVSSTDDDGGFVINVGDHPKEDYQEAGDSRKRKAKNPPLSSRLLKKPTPAVELTKSKKGKERERPIKANKKQKYKSSEFVDLSDSDTSTLTVKAQPVAASQVHPIGADDVFGAGKTARAITPAVFMPSTPREPNGTIVEPSSPSPNRHKPLAPLTELGIPHQSPSEVVPLQPSSAPPCEVVVVSQPSSAPLGEVGIPSQPPSVPATQTSPTDLPAGVRTEPTAAPNTALPLANPTGPGFPPSMAAPPPLPPNPPVLRDERLGYGDWSEQTRQVGGGYPPHAFHAPQAPAPFFPYHGSEGGMIPTQRGLMDMRRAMYFDAAGAYRDDIYRGDSRGDPRGAYGGFYSHEGPGMYPDAREPPFMGPSDERQHQAFLGHGLRPSPLPLPGPSRQPSVAPSDIQQMHGMRPSPHPLPGTSRHPSINLSDAQLAQHLPYQHPSVKAKEPSV